MPNFEADQNMSSQLHLDVVRGVCPWWYRLYVNIILFPRWAKSHFVMHFRRA